MEARIMERSAFLVAFKATSLETRASIIDWLRDRDAIHILADVWLVKLPKTLQKTRAGDIVHSIVQYDKFDAQLIVLKLAADPTDWSYKGISQQAGFWIHSNLEPDRPYPSWRR
jgi:hypothetical protein